MSTEQVNWPFDVLGFTEIPTEKREVKRAYAKRLKQIDQSADPQGFQNLRQAYEAAIGEIDYITESQNAPPPPVQVTIPTPVDPQPDQPTDFTPPDLPAAPEPDENQVDWARVNELCEQIEKPPITESNVERFRRIINDPVFQDIDAAHELESAIYHYATSKLQYIERHAEFAPQIHDVLPLIDARFGWYTDSVAFQSRFYPTPEFINVMARTMGPATESIVVESDPFLRFRKYITIAAVLWILAIFFVSLAGILIDRFNPSNTFLLIITLGPPIVGVQVFGFVYYLISGIIWLYKLLRDRNK